MAAGTHGDGNGSGPTVIPTDRSRRMRNDSTTIGINGVGESCAKRIIHAIVSRIVLD